MKKYKEFINEDKYEERFGKKETYEELKDKFKVGEKIIVKCWYREGCFEEEHIIKKIFFDVMEGHWSVELDDKTYRSLNQLKKI